MYDIDSLKTSTGVNEETRGGRMMDGMFNGVQGRFTCSGDGGCVYGFDQHGRRN